MSSDPTRSLFLYELSVMYDAELQLPAVLERLAADTAPSEASDAFRHHIGETEKHAENLRKCFDLMGADARRVTNHAVQGLARDYDAFVATTPPKELHIAFALGAAAKTEHVEMASYIGLLRQAHQLGLHDVALLLADNLRVEQLTATKVESLADQRSRAAAQEAGADRDEFRWSRYTDAAVERQVAVDGDARRYADRELREEGELLPRDHQMSPTVNPSGKGSSGSRT